MRIAVLAGGWSGEREVSLKSGRAVSRALDGEKYEVLVYDPRDDLLRLIADKERIDLAFILLHGPLGEDGCIQGFLEVFGIPYLGSGVLASAMALNKRVSREVYRQAGLQVARGLTLRRGQVWSSAEIVGALGEDIVVKPVCEGSSLGVSQCQGCDGLEEGIRCAFALGEEVLLEERLRGLEITCCVLGNEDPVALPLVAIIPDGQYPFFTYDAKYKSDGAQEICPAPVSVDACEKAGACGILAHKALGCRVWSRTDMILVGEEVFVLETNTIPGMTETSLFPKAARAEGLSLAQLLDRMIGLALGSADPG